MWLDRVTGEKIQTLPSEVEPTRFLACNPIEVNGHVTLEQGDLLVDDGSGRLLYSGQESFFHKQDEELTSAVQDDVVISALMEFQEATSQGRSRSFLLPEKLLAWLHLQPFDLAIQAVVMAGHLHEIARAPKMDLIYQEHLLPVGRVKRIPSSATRHLAAHSECWQKRSFSGVVPKTLLALESEDEFNIYENRVFSRLLDHLGRYLQRRCNEVSCIEEAIKEREKLDGSGVYWEANNAICTLWGEGFTDTDSVQAEAVEGLDTLSVLRALLRQIRGLQESRLYKAVPLKDVVDLKIKMTNTLSHDQHYRHVAKLWHQWVDYSKKERVEPGVIFSRNTKNAEAYVTYISALTLRALEELGYSKEGSLFVASGREPLSVKSEHYNLALKSGDSTLRIVPLFCQPLGSYGVASSDTLQTVVVTPDSVPFDLDELVQTGSPLYFYTLESMATRLASWLALEAVSVMNRRLNKLPKKAIDTIASKHAEYFEIEKHDAVLRAPLGERLGLVKQDLAHLTHDVSITRFLAQLEEYSQSMDALLVCPVCGSRTSVESYVPRDARCFEIEGSNCNHVWKINKTGTASRYLVVQPGDIDNSTQFGRYKWEIELPGQPYGLADN